MLSVYTVCLCYTLVLLPMVISSKCDSGWLVLLCRNIVCTVNLGCKLDLKKIALHARNAEYNPKRFAAVIMRIRDPRTTALIFSSGKMVCTGAKRFIDCIYQFARFALYFTFVMKTSNRCKFFRKNNVASRSEIEACK